MSIKLKIGGKEYEVVLSAHCGKEHGTSSSAQSSHWFQRIWLDLDQRPVDGIEADLWHEIVEMISSEYNLKLEHKDITVLGSAIHQVINDNREYFSDFNNLVRLCLGGNHEDSQKGIGLAEKAGPRCDHETVHGKEN